MTALLVKDLVQHRWWFLLCAASLLATAVIAFEAALGAHPPALPVEALRQLLMVLALVVAPFVASRLFTTELTSGGMLLLERMPVSRLQLLFTKGALGGGLVLGLALALTGAALSSSGRPLLATTSQVVLAKALLFTAATWPPMVAFSLLGRYRVPLAALSCVLLFYLHETTTTDLTRIPPLALVDERLPVAGALATGDVLGALAVLTLGAIGATALFLVRDGSVAGAMAKRMSQREKVFTVMLLGGGLFTLGVADERRPLEPYPFAGDLAFERDGVVVKLRLGPFDEAALASLPERVATTLGTARARLGIEDPPPILLTARRDLDGDHFIAGRARGARGLVVRFHPDEAFDEERLSSWLVRELLARQGGGRATLEPHAWLLDGAAPWLAATEGGAAGAPPPGLRRLLEARAVYAMTSAPERRWLEEWYRFRERVGADLAAAVSWSALSALARSSERGVACVDALLKERIGEPRPPDIRATWRDLTRSLDEDVRELCGVTVERWMERWRAEAEQASVERERLEREHPPPRAELFHGPRGPAWRVTSALPPEARVRFAYQRLGFVDEPIDDEELRIVDVPAARAQRGEPLPSPLSTGDRVGWEARVYVDALDAWLTSGLVRESL